MTNVDTFFKNLKAHRESQGINLSEISERTKINEKYFESIENGQLTVLPTVYMRLFLRSYCFEIGADPEQALKDFELYTTGKVSPIPELKFQPVEEELKDPNTKSELIDFGNSLSRKNIIYFIIGIIIIFSLVKFVSYLTQETESTMPETQINSENNDAISEILNTSDNRTDVQAFSSLPQPSQLLESYVYNTQKMVKQDAYRINTQPPFIITVTAEARTKVHITSLGSNLFNGIMNVGDSRSLTGVDTLKFDFWSAQHVKTDVNGIDLTPYLSTTDRAVRGSLVTDGSLSIQLYVH